MAVNVTSFHEKAATLEDGRSDSRLDVPARPVVEGATKDNVVGWDGPNDPQNPMNWPSWKRMAQVVIASAFLLTA
jgi:hypothetical protein